MTSKPRPKRCWQSWQQFENLTTKFNELSPPESGLFWVRQAVLWAVFLLGFMNMGIGMPEPTTTTFSGLFGIKLASLIAGLAGGVVSLSFVRELTKLQAFFAVLTGGITAHFCTPAALYYLPIPPNLDGFAGFIIGLTSINIVPGVLKLAERFKDDPQSVIRRGGGQ